MTSSFVPPAESWAEYESSAGFHRSFGSVRGGPGEPNHASSRPSFLRAFHSKRPSGPVPFSRGYVTGRPASATEPGSLSPLAFAFVATARPSRTRRPTVHQSNGSDSMIAWAGSVGDHPHRDHRVSHDASGRCGGRWVLLRLQVDELAHQVRLRPVPPLENPDLVDLA